MVFTSWRRGYGRSAHASLGEMARAFFYAIPALFMIVIILGGILGGVFTPTEASAVAVAYALFISIFVYRDLKLAMMPVILRSTLELTGMVMLVIATGSILGYAMILGGIPQQLADLIVHSTASPAVFLLFVQITFFLIGMVMDGLPALLILMPILTPIARDFGIDPIHFGILVEANVALGLAHPPVGLCLFAACAVARLPMEKVIRPLIPMIAALLITLLIVTYVPAITMFLPRLLGYAE